ncbi:MAG TPA: host-nuclease inhibitor Gam family protein [Candidatus Cloacimonadota bacterium]|nr:host-nuclease inhibitor Gam family protein [Candidatus Cloacimonadota bacterium]
MKKEPTNPITSLKSWEEVNLALKSLADLTIQKRELENAITEEVNAITERHLQVSAPLIEAINKITADVEAYVLLHKEEFVTNRTKELSYGSISCRVSKAVKVISKQICLKALKALGMEAYINVKEEPNKDMLKTLSDVELAKVGCEFKVTDNVSIEPYLEELAPREAV